MASNGAIARRVLNVASGRYLFANHLPREIHQFRVARQTGLDAYNGVKSWFSQIAALPPRGGDYNDCYRGGTADGHHYWYHDRLTP
jgi:hypothetical protein